ncbi:APC family permease [Microbacterium sp. NPDC058062]|uniref:APC family permease n=1 Tax=Microbacterium sp. NPDC058062 TaxID=3346320 RepID=UPI0036DAC565
MTSHPVSVLRQTHQPDYGASTRSILAGPIKGDVMSTPIDPAPTVADELAESEHDHLRSNSIGTWSIVFFVVSAAAPISIIAGVSPLAILIGGIGAPVVYLIAGVVLLLFAVAFMAMTRHVKALGGFYTYITKALGRVVGLGSGILALVSYNVLQIGLYGLMGVAGHEMFLAVFGIDVPWWLVAGVGIVLVFALAYIGVDIGAKVLGILLALETLLLILLAIAVLVQGGAEGVQFGTFTSDAIFSPGMFVIIAFGFAAFSGFESTVLYRAEAREPHRTIPRATYISVGFMAIFYAFMVWIVIQAFGESNIVAVTAENPAAIFFIASDRYLGTWAAIAMYMLILTSVYASQLAFHNAINRYAFALARDGILPAALHRTHPRFGSPYIAGILQTLLAAVVVAAFAILGLDPYLQLLLWVNSPGVIGVIVLQVLMSVAVVVFFARRRDLARKRYILPAAIVSSFLFIALVVLLIINIDVLTAAGPVINTILVLIVPASFLIGAAMAMRLRAKDPAAFERIGGGEA